MKKLVRQRNKFVKVKNSYIYVKVTDKELYCINEQLAYKILNIIH